MTKKEYFIEYVETLMNIARQSGNDPVMSDEAQAYWNAFKNVEEIEKPLFTDNGKLVLQFMKEHQETENWKAKDLAEEMCSSSRTVSGAMRKLVSDGFVEKIGQDPVIYTLTNKGKEIEII